MSRTLAILFLVCSVPVCILGGLRLRTNMEDVLQWLPDKSPERAIYDEFIREFGTDDFVVVSWPGCTEADPRVPRFAELLIERDQPGYFRAAVSGPELIERLGDRAKLDRDEVIARFRGFYFGVDNELTCIMVGLTELGMQNRKSSITLLEQVAGDVFGASETNIAIAGYPAVGAYGDEIIRTSVLGLLGPCAVLTMLIAWGSIRNSWLALGLLIVSGLAAGLSTAVVTLTGQLWGGLTTVIPALAFLMSLSGSVHLVNYARSCDEANFARQVFRIGWRPCLFSAITTAIGLLSLSNSDFPAVRSFGLNGAAGVIIALVCQLLLIPHLLASLRHIVRQQRDPRWQDPLFDWVVRWQSALTVGGIVVSLLLGLGILRLTANLEVERAFRRSAPVMQDIAWLEEALGPIEQTELIVRFDNPRPELIALRMELVREMEDRIRAAPQVRGTLSMAHFLPDAPGGTGLQLALSRRLFAGAIERARGGMGNSEYLTVTEDHESWRISVRVPFLGTSDFGALARDVRAAAQEVVATAPEDYQISLSYTGLSHVYNTTQEAVVSDLFANFGLAFVVICPLMMLILRSVKWGLVAMLPNLFPTLLAFGGMGLIQYPIDIGIAMTASVALGIAVDDTTHFLVRLQELAGSGPRSLSVLQRAFHQCSRAMLQTTLIAGVGLGTFCAGELSAMVRFAAVLVLLLVIALLCDLFLLPALLLRLGLVTHDLSVELTAVEPVDPKGR
ncbi:MAG: MMPL family transporter [Planctomycetaceae bacterium]|nr:MMPL family transporter [Planctomycetaceae bacterium]